MARGIRMIARELFVSKFNFEAHESVVRPCMQRATVVCISESALTIVGCNIKQGVHCLHTHTHTHTHTLTHTQDAHTHKLSRTHQHTITS